MGLRRIGRRIGRAFRRVAKFGKKVFKAVTKPINSVIGKVLQPISKILEKLPGGKLLSAFAQNFLQNPLSLLSAVGLGPVGAIFSMAGSTSQLGGFVSSLLGSIGGRTPQGLNNIMQLAAAQQARLYRGN